MKIAFYAPMKPISSARPSGDVMIARDLVDYLASKGSHVRVLSEFRARWFWHSPAKIAEWIGSVVLAGLRAAVARPQLFFTYHMYYKCPDAIAPFLSWIFRRPYVVYEASFAEKARHSRGSRFGYWLARIALSRARFVFTNMTDDYEYLKTRVEGERLVHIPPSVDTSFFKPDPESAAGFADHLGLRTGVTRILCVAMMRDDRKSEGIEFLLRSLAALVREGTNTDFELILAGDGVRRVQLEALAQELLPGKARFLGLVARADLPALYSACDFFAFPGIDEGFGLVYVEAQSAGLPVVAFDNGGIPSAVSRGESALLTPLYDEKAYAEALKLLLENRDLRSRMALAARRYALANHDRETNYSVFLAKLREAARS